MRSHHDYLVACMAVWLTGILAGLAGAQSPVTRVFGDESDSGYYTITGRSGPSTDQTTSSSRRQVGTAAESNEPISQAVRASGSSYRDRQNPQGEQVEWLAAMLGVNPHGAQPQDRLEREPVTLSETTTLATVVTASTTINPTDSTGRKPPSPAFETQETVVSEPVQYSTDDARSHLTDGPVQEPVYGPVQDTGNAPLLHAVSNQVHESLAPVVYSEPTARVAFQPGVPAEAQAEPAAGGSPFEVIEQSGEMSITMRQSKLLRTEFDTYRTAVVDESICEVVMFTPREISIIGKQTGATHVTFWFDDDQHRPVTYLIRVVPDPELRRQHEIQYMLLEDLLVDLFPDSKVELLSLADKLIVRGQAKDSAEAAQIMSIIRGHADRRQTVFGGLGGARAVDVLDESETGRPSRNIQIINMLRIPGVQQVALRVKIAEINRSAARGFGLDVKANITIEGNTPDLFLQSLLNAASGTAPAVLAQFDGDNINIGLRYLEQHGVVRILSEPTLVTLSGRPATFVAGGEFAVPTVVGTAGLSAVTTDFRSFGVIISFLPTVLDKDHIRLEVSPEFSKINSDLTVGDTPGLDVRAVTTTVEMREGQTLAIAGLLDESMVGSNTGDLPLISRIFGRRDITHHETELIILVTPELVHPMEPEEVPPLPGFDVTEPTNREFFLGGQLEGDPTREYRSTVWPHLRHRYRANGPAMISGPFGHGQ